MTTHFTVFITFKKNKLRNEFPKTRKEVIVNSFTFIKPDFGRILIFLFDLNKIKFFLLFTFEGLFIFEPTLHKNL